MRYLLIVSVVFAAGCNPSELKQENKRLVNQNVVLQAESEKHKRIAQQTHRDTARLEAALAQAQKDVSRARKEAESARKGASDKEATLRTNQDAMVEELKTKVAALTASRDRLAFVVQDMILGKTERIEAAIKAADDDAERAMLNDALKITRMRAGK